MKVLAVGDVCGNLGCKALLKLLPAIKQKYQIDLTIVNGENSAEGNGILPQSAESIFAAGADVITGGNHTTRRQEIFEKLETDPFLLRPANLPPAIAGSGYTLVDKGRFKAAVINLLGVVYLENQACPFETLDTYIKKAQDDGAKIIIVDFHAEATSEKRALGFYADGRVSALFGTHTHVATADAQVLPNGTGYITDIGMTGPIQSVLGIDKNIIIAKMKDKLPQRFRVADGPCYLNACIFEIDEKTGKCISAKQITEY